MAKYLCRVVRTIVQPVQAVALDEATQAYVRDAIVASVGPDLVKDPATVIEIHVSGQVGRRVEQEVGHVQVEAETEPDAIAGALTLLADRIGKGQALRVADVTLDSAEA